MTGTTDCWCLMASATRAWPSTTHFVRSLTMTCATHPISSSTPRSAPAWTAGCTRQFFGFAVRSAGDTSPVLTMRFFQSDMRTSTEGRSRDA